MILALLNRKPVVYILFYITFIISFYFGENSSGGAFIDSSRMETYLNEIGANFKNGIMLFIDTKMVHSPIFYIIKSILENFLNKLSSDLIFLTLGFFIPVIFYSILKKQFRGLDKNLLFAISLVLYFSPYLRSSAVWATNDNIAVLFFVLSLSKFLTFTKKKDNNLKDIFLSLFYLIIAAYIRQYYIIIAAAYAVLLFRKIEIKNFLFLILFNSILIIPMIFYTYKYLLSSSDYVIKGFAKPDLIFSPLVFFTMYLFYIFPFFFQSENYDKLKKFFKDKVIFFFIITIIFILLFFYYELPQNKYGGGIIYKISQLINSNLFFIFLSYIGAILIFLTINFNFKNLLVLLIFCFMFPFATVYQKYFDPLMIIIFFGMINSNLIYNNINLKKININFIFIYFIIFLVGANIHYYLLLKDI
tara:strand:- start:376 stop:1626 length:1251 start_codon:yes stop_codon:yes gene_type:complete